MYITEGDIEKLILVDIDATHSTFIDSIIDKVEGYIDHYCGTNFATAAGAATKYYDSYGSDEIIVDPFTAITSIKILDVNGNAERTLSTSDYYLYPLNDPTKTVIKLSDGGQVGIFPERLRSIEIVGTFGPTTVPQPIQLAAMKLAAKIINEGLRGGQIGSETLGSYSVSYRDLDESVDSLGIKEILNQYRSVALE